MIFEGTRLFVAKYMQKIKTRLLREPKTYVSEEK